MRAEDLRRAILQAAVQGKLVPQDKNDEPASELLKRIQAEKKALIKEGKLKKEKPLRPISEEEIPYDLPDKWVWCRLGEIVFENIGGGTPSKQNPEYWNGTIPWASVKDLNCNVLTTTKDYITEIGLFESSSNLIPANSIIVCTRMGLGKIVRNAVPVAINQDLRALIIPLDKIDSAFFINWYKTLNIQGGGMTVKGITLEVLNNITFPLPPLAEQQCIVAKVDELMAMCDELETAEKELDALEDRFAEYLPKSILQTAVQGKLVPQDKNDEPATELLIRIQKEKVQLVKDGKLKKEKPLPPITEEEIPYDLPDGWVWCRFGDLIQLISGRDLEPNEYNNQGNGIPYVTGASALINNNIDIVRWTEYPSVKSAYGDILLSCKGTVGKIVHNTIGDCHIARQIMSIRTLVPEIDRYYIALALETFVTQLISQAKSMIPGISRNDVTSLLFPLPPYAEQRRIVAKVEKLLALCEDLKQARIMPIAKVVDRVIPFPATTYKHEPVGMAARGMADDLSAKAMQTIANLFEEED